MLKHGISALMTSGVILNLFTIFVLRKGQKCPALPAIHHYLTAALLWQTSALFFLLLQGIPQLIVGRIFLFRLGLELVLQYGYTVSLAGRLWTMVAMTVDRFMALCHPLQHTTMATTSRAKRIILTIFMAALVFRIPDFFHYTLGETCTENEKNQTRCEYYLTLRKDVIQDFRIWLTVYDHLDTVLLYVGPRGIVVMLAVKMVRLLTEQFKKRQNLLNNSRNVQSRNKELELGSLLLIIKSGVGSFLLATLYILSLLLALYAPVTHYSYLLLVVPIVADIVNMSSNFFLFFIFGQAFRETCKEEVQRGWNRIEEGWQPHSNGSEGERRSRPLEGDYPETGSRLRKLSSV